MVLACFGLQIASSDAGFERLRNEVATLGHLASSPRPAADSHASSNASSRADFGAKMAPSVMVLEFETDEGRSGIMDESIGATEAPAIVSVTVNWKPLIGPSTSAEEIGAGNA